MKVATKLRAAFALYITLLVVLLTYHVSTIRRAVATGHQLSELSERVRATSTEQYTRIAQLGETAAKYSVTHDAGYLDKFDQLATAYAAEFEKLEQMPLSDRERKEIDVVANEWHAIGSPTRRLASFTDLASPAAAQDSLRALQNSLDALQIQTQRVGEASQSEMQERLAHSASAATLAERISWLAAIAILLLSVLVSALIARSISEPLHRLAEGTRKVAQGQFDYRLDSSRDDEFAQVGRAFNSMTERLGALDRMKRDFVTGVSHDLKTPLTSMHETISILLEELPGPLTEKQRTLLVLNQESGTRLSAMLAKLLNLSRLEGGLEPEMQVTDAKHLVRKAVSQVQGAAAEHSLDLSVTEPDHKILIECDQDRMLQVLDNLLENAIKFSPDGAELKVEMQALATRPDFIPPGRWETVSSHRAESSALWISVSDSGPGIPDSEKDRIFERFYQTPAGRSVRHRGVGLGLTICREIVTAHRGVIWVGDNPAGTGAVFNVLLPGAFRASPETAGSAALPSSNRITVS